ncbi:ABC transporter ATP-binding protein, partial [Candidatus Woesearchaeota archaeon]|nr:ABC transporter ATP-binding protein [Candidatus Woesearchaeota archaeon]
MKKIIKENKTNLVLATLWRCLSKRRQKQFYLLLILMTISSLFEIFSIGSVLPFLAALAEPKVVFEHSLMQPLIQFFELTEANQIIFPLTVIFIAAALLAGIFRLALLYVMTRLSYATGGDLSIDIYRRTLCQDYLTHVSRNSSEVINGIIAKTGTVTGAVIAPTLSLINSAMLIVVIMGVLLAIDTIIALSVFTGLSLIYLLIVNYTRKKLKYNSKLIAEQSTQMIKSLQEGLGGIRDVLIDGSQQFYCDLYQSSDLPLRHASGSNKFIGGAPKYIIEAVGMALIAVLAYILFQQKGGIVTIIPVLGALALGAQRLLPAIQQVYASYSSIKGAKSSLEDVIKLLEQPFPGFNNDILEPMPFKSGIVLKNVSYRYMPSTPWVLKNINLTLKKGDNIGFIGITGSGKSTLLDIVMGLLSETSGEVIVDGQVIINSKQRRAWQKNIAHVPQNIYLSDASIEENIAFGISKKLIDRDRVRSAAKKAQISNLIDGWKDGSETTVGERGVKLSGGQRQRIGIARALY